MNRMGIQREFMEVFLRWSHQFLVRRPWISASILPAGMDAATENVIYESGAGGGGLIG